MTRFVEEIVMIPIDEIRILNERNRNKKKHTAITDNIVAVGLKNPILVRLNTDEPHGKKYELICGQGRMESFKAAGQTHIPAITRQISRKEAAIESIAENLVRRPNTPAENIAEIKRMKDQGDSSTEIARKTGISASQMHRMMGLIEKGEDRLLAMVESGRIPVNVAVEIADAPGDEQHVLQKAYEEGYLKGKSLTDAKNMLRSRNTYGKGFNHQDKKPAKEKISSVEKLMSDYKTMVAKKRLALRKTEIVESNLKFITEAMYILLRDENFSTLLRAENLSDLPEWLHKEITEKGLSSW